MSGKNFTDDEISDEIMDQKYIPVTSEEIENIIKQHEGTLILFTREANDSGNKTAYVYWRCKNNHLLKNSHAVLKKSHTKCFRCGEIPRNLEQMKKIITQNNGIYISFLREQGRNHHLYINWRCKNDHLLKTRSDKLKIDYKCDQCANENSIEMCQKLAEDHNGTFLSTEFTNVDTYYLWQCENKNHKPFEATMYTVKKKGRWCISCKHPEELNDDSKEECIEESKEENKNIEFIPRRSWNRYTLADVQKIATDNKGRCLEEIYVNNTTDMRFICSNNHEFISKMQYLLDYHWCNTCNSSNGESLCRRIFKHIFGCEFTKVRPDFLKYENGYKLELDGYNKDLKIAFEYNGRQHEKFIPFFHKTNDEFLASQKRDSFKKEACEKNGIKLIIIPHDIEYDDIYSFILKKCGDYVPPNTPLTIKYSDLEEDNSMIINKQIMLAKITEYLDGKGAKLIDTYYIDNVTPLTILCKRNHNVYLSWNNIKEGSICLTCTDLDKIEKQLIVIDELCKENKLVLLTRDLYKDNMTPVKWKCISCDDGKEFVCSLHQLRRQQTPYCECRINPDLDAILLAIIRNISMFCEKNKLILVNDFTSETLRTDMILLKCTLCENDFLTSWNNLEQQGSYKCDCRQNEEEVISYRAKPALDAIKIFCEKFNIRMIGKYKDAITTIQWQCIKCEETTEISWHKLTQERKRFCSCIVEMTAERKEELKTSFDKEKRDHEQDLHDELSIVPKNIDNIKKLVTDLGGIFISYVKEKSENIRCNTKFIKLFCRNYHTIRISSCNLIKNGCPRCNKYE